VKRKSIIYILLENRAWLVAIVAIVAFVLRMFIMYKQEEILDSIANSLELASATSVAVIAVLIYFKDILNKFLVSQISKDKHAVIFGLSSISSTLLSNEIQKSDKAYVIVEKDIKNERIEYFRKNGIGALEGDALQESNLDKLNFDTMEFALITLGNDIKNIELAIKIIELYKRENIKSSIKLIVHITNKEYEVIFHQKLIAKNIKNIHIDIKTFSLYNEIAEEFFDQNDIDGNDDRVIKSKEPFNIVIAGDGELAMSMIYQAANTAHLPNENRLNIILVDKNVKAFKEKVIKYYSSISEVITLEAIEIDNQTNEFYQDRSIWFAPNLTHVIICYQNEDKNFAIATDLFNKTYLSDSVDGALKTQVSFAMFNNHNLSQKIDQNTEEFRQFYSFGSIQKICTYKKLIDDKYRMIAKLINKQYADTYNPQFLYKLDAENIKEIEKAWYDSARYSDKLSSISQAQHIKVKLKAMGLCYKSADKDPVDLLKHNRDVFDDILESDRQRLGLSDQMLMDYAKELPKLREGKKDKIEIKYFPERFDTLLEKLIRSEHNRWSAYHYLNGWKYSPIKSKEKKEHNCLIPLDKFDKAELKLSIIYDIYSILYIPNYLANARYEITKIAPKEQNDR